jgi:GTP-binding protein
VKITKADFLVSSSDLKQCPKPDRPEYAFIGRSNVGKSSLINMLTERRKLAKTSSSPGKTILINHFTINDRWYLVDLPGYGYAKRSKTERSKWEKMIKKYLLNRTSLLSVFVLIDSRVPPQANDLEFIDWLGMSQIPFVIVFTKADKLKNLQIEKNVTAFKNKLLENWEEAPIMIITSSTTGEGRDDVLSFIQDTNKLYE